MMTLETVFTKSEVLAKAAASGSFNMGGAKNWMDLLDVGSVVTLHTEDEEDLLCTVLESNNVRTLLGCFNVEPSPCKIRGSL